MGIYYTARAIVGFRFSLARFYRDEQRPSCPHDTQGARFCPTCGTRVGMTTQRTWLDEREELRELLEDLPRGYAWEEDEYEQVIWVGAGASADRDQSASCEMPDPDEVRRVVSGTLADVMHLIDLGPCRLWVTNIGH